MQRLTSPIWWGVSPLMLLFAALIVVGLLLQLLQGWVSPIGDAVWLLAFLIVVLIGLTARVHGNKPSVLSRAAITLLGFYSAALMAYWFAVDHGRLAMLDWKFLLPIFVFGALVVVGWIRDRRGPQDLGNEST